MPTPPLLLQGERSTHNLRVAEILCHDVEHRVRRHSVVARRLLAKLRNALSLAAIEGVTTLRHTAVGEAVRYPYKRYSAREDTHTTTQQTLCLGRLGDAPAKAYAGRNKHHRARYLVCLDIVLLGNIRCVEGVVCGRSTKDYRHIGPQAVGYREAWRCAPLILNVEAELGRGDVGRRVADRVVAHILAGIVGKEIIQCIIGVGSQRIGHIEARRVEYLVVGTNGNGVSISVVGEVVGECDGVLHQVVHNGEWVGTDIYRGVLAITHLPNLDIGVQLPTHSITTIVHSGITHTKLVEYPLRYSRVQFGNERMGVGGRGVALAIEAQKGGTRDELILSRIEEVVTQREVVA